MEHTKEPWRIRFCGVDAETHNIESDDGLVHITDAHPDDARRIVACVNACAGYSTEALEQPGGFMQTLGNALDEIKELTQQRDELLAELEKINNIALSHPYAGVTCGEVARSAIAKMKS